MISYALAAIFTRLQTASTRHAATLELAHFCGVDQVLLFGKDVDIGVFLPAPGLAQTLPRGGRWQAFLAECARAGSAHALLPAPANRADVEAFGIVDEPQESAIVFLGGQPGETERAAIAALLPLVGAKLTVERTTLAAEGHAQAARESNRRAGTLNAALDHNRRELQEAYQRVECELVSRRAAEERLREADRRKDEFLAMLAHELRNPLAPISMAAQILKLGAVSEQRLRQTSDIIDRQVNHMTSLLDDLLDVSRVTRGLVTLALDLHDLDAIAHDAIEQARPLIVARDHRLHLQLARQPVQVYGDSTRLVQVITNLLNNATKYTAPGGDIWLAMTVEPGTVELCVSDNGIGIDATLLPLIFDLFTQGERSPDRAQGGLGLGLALARSLVDRHGGSLTASSAGAGRGSRFTMRLPRACGLPGG